MNYLAHVLLAGESPEARIGGLLGDFVKGDPAGLFPPVMEREIRIHRQLDAYGDAHPVFREALLCFPRERRRFGGLALDVFFDHALALRWKDWCAQDLEAFTQDCYRALQAHQALLPERLLKVLPALIQHDWLASYRHRTTVDLALRRMAERRMRRGEGLVACLGDLEAAYPDLLASFDRLFPELWTYADTVRNAGGS